MVTGELSHFHHYFLYRVVLVNTGINCKLMYLYQQVKRYPLVVNLV
jgi:hypothetical protein